MAPKEEVPKSVAPSFGPIAALATVVVFTPIQVCAQSLSVELVDNTPYEIKDRQASTASTGAWGGDVLGGQVLQAGETTRIELAPPDPQQQEEERRLPEDETAGRTCERDLLATLGDGGSHEWKELNLCGASPRAILEPTSASVE